MESDQKESFFKNNFYAECENNTYVWSMYIHMHAGTQDIYFKEKETSQST